MWVRSAAIRPIPPHAELPELALTLVEDELAGDEDQAEQHLSEAFERFESTQPALAHRIGTQLNRTTDEVAVALGYFLSLVVWLAFDTTFGSKLARVSEVELDGVEQALSLDEELRGADPAEALDTDDVVAMEQPHVLRFLHEHVDAALEAHADDADVDAIHGTYRLVLVEVLALSYAVAPPKELQGNSSEICA